MDIESQLLAHKSKRALFADLIREKILSGEFKNGDRLLPDSDLSQKYRLNKRTVAAGLNTLAKEGFLERRRRVGTVVKRAREDSRLSSAVGMVMMSEGEVYGDIFRLITERLVSSGLYPVLISNQMVENRGCVVQFLNSLVSERSRPHGFIIDGDANFPFDFLIKKLDLFHNIVFMNKFSYKERISPAKYALLDYMEAGRMVARHLIGNGHRRLAFLPISQLDYRGEWSSLQVPILRGFAEVCREKKASFPEEAFWSLLHGAHFDSAVAPLLKGRNRPTGIFQYMDFYLRGSLLPLIEKCGLKPMKDVELVGFYNTHHAEECGFSSVGIQEQKLADAAVRLLIGESGEDEIVIPPELVVRGGR